MSTKSPESKRVKKSATPSSSGNAALYSDHNEQDVVSDMLSPRFEEKFNLEDGDDGQPSYSSMDVGLPISGASGGISSQRSADDALAAGVSAGDAYAPSGHDTLDSGSEYSGSTNTTDDSFDPTDYLEEEDEEVGNYINTLETVEIVEIMKSSKVEGHLDIDNGDDMPTSNQEIIQDVDPNRASFTFGKGEVVKIYDELKESPSVDNTNPDYPFLPVVSHLVGVTLKDYSGFSPSDLQSHFNAKQQYVFEEMKKSFIARGYPEWATQVNMASCFSLLHKMLVILHYGPEGCKHCDGKPSNFCHPNQCCIRCMQSNVPSFLLNEQARGLDFMLHNKWHFGGKMDIPEKRDEIAFVDMVPVLLPKKDSEAEMIRQYEGVADALGLPSYHHMFVITYCFVKMHVILSGKRERKEEGNGQKFQILAASAAVAKHFFGFPNGTTKYLFKINGHIYVLYLTIHPQGEDLICSCSCYVSIYVSNIAFIHIFRVIYGNR